MLFSLALLLLTSLFLDKNKKKSSFAQEPNPASLALSDVSETPANLNQEFSYNISSGDEFDLFVHLYTGDYSILGADVEMDFDPQVIEILGKTEEAFFPLYVEPVEGGYLDSFNGKIYLSGVTFDMGNEEPTASISGRGKFVKFRIKVKDGLTPQVSEINFDPQDSNSFLTTDSNIIALVGEEDNPEDVLGQVKPFKVIIDQPADINGDSQVNLTDIMTIAQNYQLPDYKYIADYNRDGQVNLTDLMMITQNYNNSY